MDFSKYRGKPLKWWLRTPLYVAALLPQRNALAWKLAGRPVRGGTFATAPPHGIKREAVREAARAHGLRVLVETGTFRGDMVGAMLSHFARIHSIELSPVLYEAARARFAQQPRVTLWQGDSALLLPRVLETLCEPALFWLDGHYSEGETARGAIDTPIMAELEAIFARAKADPHGVGRSVLLIDDARCFGSPPWPDYPLLPELRAFINRSWPRAAWEVRDDIIRVELAPLQLQSAARNTS